jgi:hypothetical protein
MARQVCFIAQLLSVLQMVDKLLCWRKQMRNAMIKIELMASYRCAWVLELHTVVSPTYLALI